VVIGQRQKELKAKIREEKEKAALLSKEPRKLAPRPLRAEVQSESSTGSDSGDVDGVVVSALVAKKGAHASNSRALVAAPKKKQGDYAEFVDAHLARMADPYMNGLQQAFVNVYHATMRNSIALRFDLVKLAQCSTEYSSPIYQPDATPQTDMRVLFARSGLPRDLPANLRPTRAQYLVPHHPCIDLIPIPSFRDRAIILAATQPEQYSLDDLKADVYHHDGLLVWGSVGARQEGGRDDSFWDYDYCQSSQWQPWDRRAWEAAPWFLQKWSKAVGGPDGELSRQSRWWNSVREARKATGVAVTAW
jgi:hypothetical protein